MKRPAETKYLLVTLHGAYYALDLSHTTAVEEPSPLSPIPTAPPLFSGALNFHNRIVAVCDLALALNLPPLPATGKLVVLNPALASLAFQVENVLRIVTADDVIEVAPGNGLLQELVFTIAEGNVPLLDTQALVTLTETALIQQGV